MANVATRCVHIEVLIGQCIENPAGSSGPPHLLSPWGRPVGAVGVASSKTPFPAGHHFRPKEDVSDWRDACLAPRSDENRYVSAAENGAGFHPRTRAGKTRSDFRLEIHRPPPDREQGDKPLFIAAINRAI